METKFLENIVGHTSIKSILYRLLEKGKLPHALLFYGPDGVGKEAMGLELGRFLLCPQQNPPCNQCPSCKQAKSLQHPDLYFLFPIRKPKKEYTGGEWEGALSETELELYVEQIKAKTSNLYYRIDYPGASDILIGQVRHLIQQSALTSFYNGNRFALISPVDQMNKEAQNSLLKLLEDPPSNFYFCLVTSHPEQVLPTIVSRCQGFRFAPLKKDEIIQGLKNLYGVSDQQAQFATAQADGSLVKAIEILHTGDIARTIAIDEFIMKQVIMRKLEELYKQVRNSKDLDKRQMKDILLNIDHWLRDIMLMNVGLEPVYNADLLDRLIKFQNNIKYDNLLELRKILLLMIDLIEKNVYIELIYLNLIHKFQKNMSLKK